MYRLLSFLMLLLLFLISGPESSAQCAMCSMTAMDAMRDGSTTSLGLNNAILYLLALPYVLVMTIGGMWYLRHRRLAKLGE